MKYFVLLLLHFAKRTKLGKSIAQTFYTRTSYLRNSHPTINCLKEMYFYFQKYKVKTSEVSTYSKLVWIDSAERGQGYRDI